MNDFLHIAGFLGYIVLMLNCTNSAKEDYVSGDTIGMHLSGILSILCLIIAFSFAFSYFK